MLLCCDIGGGDRVSTGLSVTCTDSFFPQFLKKRERAYMHGERTGPTKLTNCCRRCCLLTSFFFILSYLKNQLIKDVTEWAFNVDTCPFHESWRSLYSIGWVDRVKNDLGWWDKSLDFSTIDLKFIMHKLNIHNVKNCNFDINWCPKPHIFHEGKIIFRLCGNTCGMVNDRE